MKRYKWGVMVGQPTSKHPYFGSAMNYEAIGKWCVVPDKTSDKLVVQTFKTRKEAREAAKKKAIANDFWHFHPKKYIP